MTVLALLDTNEVYARSRPSLLRNVGASGPPCHPAAPGIVSNDDARVAKRHRPMPAPRSEIVPGWGPVATGPVRLAAPPGSLRGHDLESAYREKLSGNSCALAAAAGGNRHVAPLVPM